MFGFFNCHVTKFRKGTSCQCCNFPATGESGAREPSNVVTRWKYLSRVKPNPGKTLANPSNVGYLPWVLFIWGELLYSQPGCKNVMSLTLHALKNWNHESPNHPGDWKNCLIFPTSTVKKLPETFMVPSNPPPSQPNLTWGSGEFGSFRLVFLAWKDGTPRGTNRAWWACEPENIYDPMTVWSICLFFGDV